LKLFIDSANIKEIREANNLGIISGVTTNPSLFAREKKNKKEFHAVIREISDLINGPVSAEIISLDLENILREAHELAKINKNIVIKIPVTKEGLCATKILHEEKIKVNMTLVFSSAQALLAAHAGAEYVSPFVGRLDDISFDGIELIDEIAKIFNKQNIKTKIIAASIRSPLHVVKAGIVGADIATVSYEIICKMIEHPLSKIGIEKFLKDWNEN